MISTEPLVTRRNIADPNNSEFNETKYINGDQHQERMSETADKSCSTSFDSMEDSSLAQGSTTHLASGSSTLLTTLQEARYQMNLLSAGIASIPQLPSDSFVEGSKTSDPPETSPIILEDQAVLEHFKGQAVGTNITLNEKIEHCEASLSLIHISETTRRYAIS